MTLQVYDSDKLEDKEWGNFDRFGGKEYMLGYHKALSDIKNISREISEDELLETLKLARREWERAGSPHYLIPLRVYEAKANHATI